MKTGDKIKILRKKAGLKSQEKLAELVGVARQTVCLWERNIFMPDIGNLERLAEVLNTTVSYLSGQSDNPNGISFGQTPLSDENTSSTQYIILSPTARASGIIERKVANRVVRYEISQQKIKAIKEILNQAWDKIEKLSTEIEGENN